MGKLRPKVDVMLWVSDSSSSRHAAAGPESLQCPVITLLLARVLGGGQPGGQPHPIIQTAKLRQGDQGDLSKILQRTCIKAYSRTPSTNFSTKKG